MSLSAYAISKNFDEVEALKRVDLHVESGEFFTLLGPSGCGKTTLLRIIAGLEIADSGMVMLDGRNITPTPARERPVNTVFQSYALFPHLTVMENVCFGLISRKVPKATALEKGKAILDMVQLQGYDDRRPSQLSGGQQQRVALARALVNEPKVLLLDEPMSALDAKLRLQVQVELRQLQQRLGHTFLMVTHDQSEALTVSDRMAVMKDGDIAQLGTTREVFSTPRSEFVADFLGVGNIFDAQPKGEHTAATRFGDVTVEQTLPLVPCKLAIRPEYILVSRKPGSNTVEAVVETVIYQGARQLIITDSGLEVRVNGTAAPAAGDRIHLRFPEDSLVVLYE